MKPSPLLSLLSLLLAAPFALAAGVVSNAVPFAATALGTPVVHDGYLYLSADSLSGGGLAVFDLENPAAPAFAAGVRTAGPASAAPVLLGDTAYLPTEAGIEVFDVTRPEEPASVRLVTPHAPRSSLAGLRLVGERLVAHQSDAIRLYDLSDPFAPRLTDAEAIASKDTAAASSLFLAAAPFAARNCATNHLFRIDSGRFVDCGPLAEEVAPPTNTPGLFFVTDKIAYVPDGPDAIRVADFTDPRRPDVSGATNVPSAFLPPQGQRGRLFAGRTNVLDVISVWKPLDPHYSRSVIFPADVDVSRLRLAGDLAYLSDDASSSLRTYSIAGSNAVLTAEARFRRPPGRLLLADTTPLEQALHRAPGMAAAPDVSYDEVFHEDIALVGGHIVSSIASHDDEGPTGITLANVATHLARTSTVHTVGGTIHGFCADPATNRLFVADSLAISVFRLVDGGLVEEARFPLSRHPLYGPRALALADNGTNHVLLAACGADGLRAYELVETNLILRAACETGGFACDVAVSGDRIFVADGEQGVTVCRLEDDKLLKLRTYALPRGTATALAAKDGIAYVAAGSVPLAILADGVRPLPLAARDKDVPGAYALDIALVERGDRLYALLADGRAGLSLYDVTDPRAPAFVSLLTADEVEYTSFHSVVALCTDGRLVYALDASDHLLFAMEIFPDD
ncbi:MAG: hypothetical protein IJQ73_09875 [Kiritimatiellae bacterium]|nr:hypothetical protein [Kiritimatiellia bacterium]